MGFITCWSNLYNTDNTILRKDKTIIRGKINKIIIKENPIPGVVNQDSFPTSNFVCRMVEDEM